MSFVSTFIIELTSLTTTTLFVIDSSVIVLIDVMACVPKVNSLFRIATPFTSVLTIVSLPSTLKTIFVFESGFAVSSKNVALNLVSLPYSIIMLSAWTLWKISNLFVVFSSRSETEVTLYSPTAKSTSKTAIPSPFVLTGYSSPFTMNNTYLLAKTPPYSSRNFAWNFLSVPKTI